MAMSGAQRRKDRVARGLPKYTPNENQRTGWGRYASRIAQIKLDAGCTDCGYKDHPDALEFDHLPEFEKIAAVSTLARQGASWVRLEAEIAKCEVVCANCHRIRSRARRAS